MDNTDVWNSNDIDSIDRKINQSAIDNLDALENTLNHINELDDEAYTDLLDNLDGAHQRGWRTIWISPSYKESNKYPFVDKAFPTLKDALDKLNF